MRQSAVIRAAFATLAIALSATLPVLGTSVGAEPPKQVASGLGIATINGHPAVVEVLVEVPPDRLPAAVTSEALRTFGARPIREDPAGDFVLTLGGLHWPQFADAPRKKASVEQQHNPAGAPADADDALRRTQATWSGVKESVFAITYGGTTDRCVSFFECDDSFNGFNDVGWADFFDPFTLGLTVTYFRFDDLSIVEADILMNTGVSWDDGGYDLETVLLHENGHLAGLDHTSSPDSVMFPFLGQGQIKRELTESEVAGITYLYPRASHPQPTNPIMPAPPVRAEVLATLGDPVPGGGALDHHYEMGEISDSGAVMFTTDVTGGQPFDQVAARADGTTLVELARAGGAATRDATFGLGSIGPVAAAADDDGVFGFLAGELDFPLGLNSGVFRADGVDQPQSLALPGDVAPDGRPILGAGFADISRGDIVVFSGMIQSEAGFFPELAQAVYRIEDGVLSTVVAPGDPGPGGTFDYVGVPTINDSGTVVFDGHMAGQLCAGRFTDLGCEHGVYARHPDGSIEVIARGPSGAPPPPPGPLTEPSPLSDSDFLAAATGGVVNAGGEVLFGAQLFGESGPVHALQLRDATGIRNVVRGGQPLPGGGHLREFFLPFFTGRPHWALSDDGAAVFIGPMKESLFPDGAVSNGVFLDRGRGLEVVARSGSLVPGVGTIRAIGTLVQLPPTEEDPFPGFFIAGGVTINNRGQIAFPATLTDGRVVLLRTHG